MCHSACIEKEIQLTIASFNNSFRYDLKETGSKKTLYVIRRVLQVYRN